jgi:hypothetical protein
MAKAEAREAARAKGQRAAVAADCKLAGVGSRGPRPPDGPEGRGSPGRRDRRVRGHRAPVHDERRKGMFTSASSESINAEVAMIRTWSAHERVSVKRATAEEDKR